MQALQALAWLSAEELTQHPNGDAFLVSRLATLSALPLLLHKLSSHILEERWAPLQSLSVSHQA